MRIPRINEYWINLYDGRITRIKIQCPSCERLLPVEKISADRAHQCICGKVFIEIEDPKLRITYIQEDFYPPCGIILNEPN